MMSSMMSKIKTLSLTKNMEEKKLKRLSMLFKAREA